MSQVSLGEYVVEFQHGRLSVAGPDERACQRAENQLYALLSTDEGPALFGRARLTSTIDGDRARTELAQTLGLYYEAGATPKLLYSSAPRKLDYDDDHRKIRTLNLPRIITRTITEFEGLCAAIVYDGIVDDGEVTMLREWLAAKSEFLHVWPLCEVHDLMEKILEDGVVDASEREELFALLDSIGASADKCGKPAESIFDNDPMIEFPGRTFLFTGRLDLCKRKDAQAAVQARGGRATSSVVRRLDYLVVGDLGTDAWQYSRYGRKIEAVMENRRAGGTTLIIREQDFAKSLERIAPSS
jgi:hypothetical protein